MERAIAQVYGLKLPKAKFYPSAGMHAFWKACCRATLSYGLPGDPTERYRLMNSSILMGIDPTSHKEVCIQDTT